MSGFTTATTLTSNELRVAESADLVLRAGYPSQVEAENLVSDGNIINIPADDVDVKRYYQKFGEPPAAVIGEITRMIPDTRVLHAGDIQKTIQVLPSDIMM